jgi:hypothetical protein
MSKNPFKYGLGDVVKVTLGYEVVSAKVIGLYIHPITNSPRYLVEYTEGILAGTQAEHYKDTLDLHLIKPLSEYPQGYNDYSPNTLVRPAFNP